MYPVTPISCKIKTGVPIAVGINKKAVYILTNEKNIAIFSP